MPLTPDEENAALSNDGFESGQEAYLSACGP